MYRKLRNAPPAQAALVAALGVLQSTVHRATVASDAKTRTSSPVLSLLLWPFTS